MCFTHIASSNDSAERPYQILSAYDLQNPKKLARCLNDSGAKEWKKEENG